MEVDHEAVVLTEYDACDEYDEPPDGGPRFHPRGRERRAARRCLVGSPKDGFEQEEQLNHNKKKYFKWFEGMTNKTNLPVTSDFYRLVFVPGIGQVSCFSERKFPPGKHQSVRRSLKA